ncbi:hypothetical protein CM15mP35_01610 [bacterium]|nr:MAG: hypothetical protein CM15mP35_01610 [bacterium]
MADVAIKNGFNVIGIQRPLPKHRNKQIIFRLKELNIFDKVKFEVLDLTKKLTLITCLRITILHILHT